MPLPNQSSKLSHRNQRLTDNHSLYHTNLLGDHTQLLQDIKDNTGNINLNVDTLEVNTDGLETLITETNAKLDTFSGHTNNTITIGDGSTQLRTVPLGYDRTNGKAVSFLVDAAGHQQVDAVDVTAKLDSLAGAGNNNIGEGSSKLQIYNYGRDVSAGNYKPMVVNSSAEQIVALSSVDNAVLDTIAAKHTDSEAHLGNIDTGIDVLEACVGSNKVNVNISSGTIALPTGASTEATLAAAEVHLGNIDTGVDVLEACVGSNKMNVNISSGNISGFATESTLSAAEVHLGNIETAVQVLDNAISGSEMQCDIVSSALPTGAATQTTLAAAEVHLGNIDTGVDVLEACVGSNKVNVNISSGNISGFATESTLSAAEVHLGNIETAVQVLDNAISGSEMQCDIVSSALPTGAATQTTLAAAEVHLGNIDTGVDVLEACVGSNKVNVNISSGNISGFATSTLQGTTNSKLDTLETTLTAIETDQAALEVLHTATNSALTTIDSVLDTIKVDTEAIETAVEAIQTHTQLTTVTMFSGETVNSGGDTHTSSATEIIKSPANGLNFLIKSSSGSVDAGDFTVNFLVSADNSAYSTLNTTFKQAVNDGLFQQVRIADYVPKFIKMTITNNDFSSNSDFDAHLFY